MIGGGSTARALTIDEIGFSTRLAKWSGDGPVGVTTVTKGPARTEAQVHLSVTSGHVKVWPLQAARTFTTSVIVRLSSRKPQYSVALSLFCFGQVVGIVTCHPYVSGS